MLWYKTDTEKTWKFITEIKGKNTKYETHRPRKIVINKQRRDHKSNRNYSWIQYILKNISTKLASKIPNTSKPFESFMKQLNATMKTHFLSINELSFNIVKIVLVSYMNRCSYCLICHKELEYFQTVQLFHDWDPHYLETSVLICRASQ